MKVLLDESVPKQLKAALNMFETYTLNNMNWLGTKNGKLLAKAEEANFDVFITVDKNLQHQQNIASFSFGVIVINVLYVKWEYIEPLMLEIIDTIYNKIERGKVVTIEKKLIG